MTAINIALLDEEIYCFSDGGQFSDDGVLRMISAKTQYLPVTGALFAWCGDLAFYQTARTRAELLAAWSTPTALPAVSAGAGGSWTAMLAGLTPEGPLCLVLEESGRALRLERGAQVRTLSSPVPLDPREPDLSGLAIMEDQRARHGFVGGYCIRHRLHSGGLDTRVLRRWPDRIQPYSGQSLRSAKIQELSLETANFDDEATILFIDTETAASIPNAEGLPVIFTVYVRATYSANYSAGQGTLSYTVTRTRGSLVVASGQKIWNGQTTGRVERFYASGIDTEAEDEDTYTLSVSGMGTGVGPGVDHVEINEKKLKIAFIKR